MELLHVAHLMVLGMWLGVVITEALFEFAASDAESLRAAARFHLSDHIGNNDWRLLRRG
jgi:hypothetical protein